MRPRRRRRAHRQRAESYDGQTQGRDDPVVDDRVGFRQRCGFRQLLGVPIRRTEDDPARQAVEFDQRGGGDRHVADMQDDAAAIEFGELFAERRGVREIGERQTAVAGFEDAITRARARD